MKKLLIATILFSVAACEAQPNRPITLIDRIDRINNATPAPVIEKTNIVFKGQILDVADETPIAYAKISLGQFKAVSDASGYFSISDVPTGIYILLITKEGYLDEINDRLELKSDFGRIETFMEKIKS